jgi:hypothetical protein
MILMMSGVSPAGRSGVMLMMIVISIGDDTDRTILAAMLVCVCWHGLSSLVKFDNDKADGMQWAIRHAVPGCPNGWFSFSFRLFLTLLTERRRASRCSSSSSSSSRRSCGSSIVKGIAGHDTY